MIRLLLDRLAGPRVRSLFAAILVAFAAGSSWAPSASALTWFYLSGSPYPGTNTYSIVMSYDASDRVQGYATSVSTTGIYTGVASTTNPAPFNHPAGSLDVTPGSTGVVSTWGAVSSGVNGPGGTFTIGTIRITVAAGTELSPFIRPGLDGFLVQTTGGLTTTVAPDRISVEFTPEPAPAPLLVLGLLGLAVNGRRRR